MMTGSHTRRPALASAVATAPDLSRRAAMVLSLAGSIFGGGVATAQDKDRPADVGRKFEANGQVRPFAGNTFVGHVPQQGSGFEAFDALLRIYREFPAHAFHDKVALLPPSSYHVTVFGGMNEADRGTARWPSGVPGDLALDAANSQWLERLKRRSPLAPSGFDFVLGTPPRAQRDGAPHIPLRPADEPTARRLTALRDELSLLTGIRRADHDRYDYHLTFGYIHRFLTDAESQDLQAATVRWMTGLPPVLRIPEIHFCRFKDMYAFETLQRL